MPIQKEIKITEQTPIENLFRLSPFQKKSLQSMGIKNVLSLLRYFPRQYESPNSIKAIEYILPGENAVIFGKIKHTKARKTFRSRVAITEAEIEDASGKVKAIWFNQPYISKMYGEGEEVRIEGKVSKKNGVLCFSNPKIEKLGEKMVGAGGSLFGPESDHFLNPIYRESRNISSNWIHHSIQKIFKSGALETLEDPIPEDILKKYNLPKLKTALIWIHTPKKLEDSEVAKKRFAFEEIFLIQLDRQRERLMAKKEKSFKIEKTNTDIENFIKSFPFPLTSAQNKTLDTVLQDFKKGEPMSRLLEGDVGSGKTAVAASAAYAAISTPPPERKYGALQVAYMAPTEILAEQHFESFIEYFAKYNIQIGLLTSSGAKKFPSKINKGWTKISKPQLLKWVETGEIPILIGTHSLIQKKVKFKNLAFIIIDEQHRFGVKQRMELRKKHDIVPHLLSMTATPIPRTLALTIFGDLDLSILDELPPGRKPVETKIVLQNERKATYEKVRAELKTGRQAYVICPRIDPSDPNNEFAINTKSVKEEAESLKKIFPEFKVALLTGKMSPKEKEDTMRDFKDGKYNILVATSVIEVGVNVPNATTIIIENAERFGLAQLHQLRGRVLRSSYKPYCYVFADTQSKTSLDRLKSFASSSNGFLLAEADLKQRGAGNLLSGKQWGVSDIAMEALKNIKMVEAAREEAVRIVENDFDLDNYPLLHNLVVKKEKQIHLE